MSYLVNMSIVGGEFKCEVGGLLTHDECAGWMNYYMRLAKLEGFEFRHEADPYTWDLRGFKEDGTIIQISKHLQEPINYVEMFREDTK